MTAEARSNQVELVGYYGGDLVHALSAWTSTSRDLTPEKKARVPALLARLAKDCHHTPFEKSALHFLVTTDVSSHIHMIKHRISVSINAESARYKELRDDRFLYPSDWPSWQDATEGDEERRVLASRMRNLYIEGVARSLSDYHELVDLASRWFRMRQHEAGEVRAANSAEMEKKARSRAKESARFVRPYAGQITADVMFNWRSFMHFVKLRADPHAQLEVRELALEMVRLVREIPGAPFEHSLAAFGYGA